MSRLHCLITVKGSDERGGDLGQVPDDFLILLTILDSGYYKLSGYYQTFLLEKVAARQLALTERLVLILDLGREEGC